MAQKSGSWFSYGEIRLGQGRENAKQFIRENADLFEEMKQKVLEKRGLVVGAQMSEEPAPEKESDET